MQIHYLQHVPFEEPANLEQWAKINGHSRSITKFHEGDSPPEMHAFDWLVVMGGPMGVGDDNKYPWLAQEKRLIERAIKGQKTVIGICLGAQLIADVLGAKVTKNKYKEIGWFPIQLTNEAHAVSLINFLPENSVVFHWHGDTFDIPSGAIRLAQSEACANQAFIYGEKILALQFHLEAKKESVQNIIANCKDDLTEGKYIQKPDEMLSRENDFSNINRILDSILDRLVSPDSAVMKF